MASLLDFQDYARHTMSQKIFEALEDGAGDQVTKRLNEEDFVKIKIKQRGMANMKYFKGTQTKVFGRELQTPIALGGVPWQKTYHYDGEAASAQAA